MATYSLSSGRRRWNASSDAHRPGNRRRRPRARSPSMSPRGTGGARCGRSRRRTGTTSERQTVRTIEVLEDRDRIPRAGRAPSRDGIASTRRGTARRPRGRPSGSTARARGPPSFSATASTRKPAGHGDVLRLGDADACQRDRRGHPPRRDAPYRSAEPRPWQRSIARCPRASTRLRSSERPMRRLVLVVHLITLLTAAAAVAQEADRAPHAPARRPRDGTGARRRARAPDHTEPHRQAVPSTASMPAQAWCRTCCSACPGVTLRTRQGNRFQPSLTMRGFTSSPVTGLPQGLSVFLDGVRLNEPTVDEVNFDLIPLDDVERIEVVRDRPSCSDATPRRRHQSRERAAGARLARSSPEVAVGSFGRQEYRPQGQRLRAAVRLHRLGDPAAGNDGYRDASGSRVSRAFAKLGLGVSGSERPPSRISNSNNRIKQAGSLPESEVLRHPRRTFTAGRLLQPRAPSGESAQCSSRRSAEQRDHPPQRLRPRAEQRAVQRQPDPAKTSPPLHRQPLDGRDGASRLSHRDLRTPRRPWWPAVEYNAQQRHGGGPCACEDERARDRDVPDSSLTPTAHTRRRVLRSCGDTRRVRSRAAATRPQRRRTGPRRDVCCACDSNAGHQDVGESEDLGAIGDLPPVPPVERLSVKRRLFFADQVDVELLAAQRADEGVEADGHVLADRLLYIGDRLMEPRG